MNAIKRTGTPPGITLAPPKPAFSWRAWLGRIGRLFPRNAAPEAVGTTMFFEATPEEVWRGILFYEEVPNRPQWLLRLFLPLPVRTEGDKKRVGAPIHCTYESGHIVKRMTSLDGPRAMHFEVVEQQLGVESCITMLEGSYELRAVGGGCEVVLTTHYRGHLRPRWLWRGLERYLAHGLHRHILEGMRDTLTASCCAGRARALPRASERECA